MGAAVTSTQKFADALERERPAAIYVCASLTDSVPEIAEVAHRLGVLTFTATEANLTAGLGIGVFRRGERISVVVNLPETRAESADLDSAFLRIAEVIQ